MRPNPLPTLMTTTSAAALLLSLAACGGAGEAEPAAANEPTAEARQAAGEPQGSFLARLFQAEPRIYEVPAGTVLQVRFEDHLSSHTSQSGSAFRTTVTQGVSIDGEEAIPAGAVVRGTIVEARGPKKVGGRAQLELDFHTLELPEAEPVAIAATFSARGRSETPKDAAIIGGSTLAGAILGEKVDDGEGGVIGAIVGGVAGTAAAIKTKGKPVEVPSGTVMSIELTRPVTVRVG